MACHHVELLKTVIAGQLATPALVREATFIRGRVGLAIGVERDVVTQHCLPVAGTYTVSAEFARCDVIESHTCPRSRFAVDDIIPN